MRSIANCLSCGCNSLSKSSSCERPELPSPFTLVRRTTWSERFWARLSSLTCLVAASESWIAMASLAPVFYPLQREELRHVLIHQLGQAHRVEQPAERHLDLLDGPAQ